MQSNPQSWCFIFDVDIHELPTRRRQRSRADQSIKTNNILVKFSSQFEEKNSMLWQNNFR